MHGHIGIPAAYYGHGVATGDIRHHGECASAEGVYLEDPHGAVPYYGLGVLYSLAEERDRGRANVERHPVLGYLLVCDDLGLGRGAELVRHDEIHRHVELYTLFLGQLDDLSGFVQHRILAEGVSYLVAERLEECQRHAAADDELVDLVAQA